jgi:ABC-type cobalt transport system substrate-binding protein
MSKTRCAILICMVLVLLTTQTAWAVDMQYMPSAPQNEMQVKYFDPNFNPNFNPNFDPNFDPNFNPNFGPNFGPNKKVFKVGGFGFAMCCRRRTVRVRWISNLTRIARRFNARRACLARANGIRSWRVIHARRPGVLFRARKWLVIPCYCRR